MSFDFLVASSRTPNPTLYLEVYIQSPSFAASVVRNQGRQCNATGCGHPRFGIALYCSKHVHGYQRYGHPFGGPLSSTLWAPQRQQVSDLIDRNPDHPGVKAALEVVSGLQARAVFDQGSFSGAEEFARLSARGVYAKTIVVELCAVTLYLHANPRTVRDDRAWDFAVSRAVFKLAPRERRTTRGPGGSWPVHRSPQQQHQCSYSPKARLSALAFVGKHLRESLAPFLGNVRSSIETRDEQRMQLEAAMSAPLRVS